MYSYMYNPDLEEKSKSTVDMGTHLFSFHESADEIRSDLIRSDEIRSDLSAVVVS